MKRILAIHLLNDRSGSPFVFRQSLEALVESGNRVVLFTSKSKDGFLSDIKGVEYKYLKYQWSPVKLITLLRYLWVNLIITISFIILIKKDDVVYINSMLPYGAAIAGKIRRKKVIFHMHEVSIKPKALKNWLIKVVNICATQCIHVSNFLRDALKLKIQKQAVVYNSLPKDFIDTAQKSSAGKVKSENFTILMVCSLKDFKGIPEFIKLSQSLPEYCFQLVLNANDVEINNYFSNYNIPKNLLIYPAQTNVHPFYKNCDVLVNLSRTDEWLETFGMTVLEGMYYGKPCIVPEKGGASELVEHNFNGYHINGVKTNSIKKTIHTLAEDHSIYLMVSHNAIKKAQNFNPESFKNSIKSIFNSSGKISID